MSPSPSQGSTKEATDRMRVMAVAKLMGWRYTKARDMMLSGKLGEPSYGDGEPLTVPKDGVLKYKSQLDAKRAAGKTPSTRGVGGAR